MLQVNLNRNLLIGLILALLFLNHCNKIYDERQMMAALVQQEVESASFIDSLKLEAEPHDYNSQYECLSLVKLNDNAPNILSRYWFFWKTYSVDSIGYVYFDDFFEIEGIPKNEALIVTNVNRERVYFYLLTFEEDRIEIKKPFLVLENEFDNGTYCLEIDYLSVHFKGQNKKSRTKIDAAYTYKSKCKAVEDKKVASLFWIKK